MKAFFQKITRKQWIVIGIAGSLLIAGGITFVLLAGNDAQANGSAFFSGDSGPIKASGFIEAEEIALAPLMGGRVLELPFTGGALVEEGDVLARLDASLLEAQRAIAQANLELTEAQRDLIIAGARDEIIEQADLQVQMAEAAVAATSTILGDIATLRDNPQEILLHLIDAGTQVAVAQQGLTAAQIQFDMARIGYESADRAATQLHDLINQGYPVSVPLEVATAVYQYQQAEANLQGAQDALAGTQDIFASVQSMAENPATIQLQVAEASAKLESARADLAKSRADLELIRSGASDSQITIADARVEEAQASVDSLDIMLERFTIKAPIGGMVLNLALHPGELSVPGIPVVTIANLDQVQITVYLAALDFSQVSLNQMVTVRVDTYPGQDFTGTVVQIADQAEFTPQNVQTSEERVNLVYAVKIVIENSDHTLKPGMPADVYFVAPERAD